MGSESEQQQADRQALLAKMIGASIGTQLESIPDKNARAEQANLELAKQGAELEGFKQDIAERRSCRGWIFLVWPTSLQA